MQLSIQWIIWLFPVVFLIHDGEEILTVERWLKANHEALAERLGGLRWGARVLKQAEMYTTAGFSTIVVCLFVGICAASYLAAQGQYVWFAAGLAVLFINVCTHLGQSLLLRRYTPGVFSAALLVLPYALVAYARLLTDGLLTWATIWLSVPLGLLATGLLFVAGNGLASRLFPGRNQLRGTGADG